MKLRLPRIVQALWFEEVGLFYEPILDTPVGRLTLKQTGFLIAFAGVAWTAALIFEDIILKIAVGGAIFIFGIAVFTRRTKTLPLEKSLLFALGIGRMKQRSPISVKTKKRAEGDRKFEQPPIKMMKVSATLDGPVKIVGVLRDPSTGRVLSARSFEFTVDGVWHSSGVTDEQGFFTVFFAPQRLGTYRVEVQPEGYAGVSQRFEIQVESKEGVRIV